MHNERIQICASIICDRYILFNIIRVNVTVVSRDFLISFRFSKNAISLNLLPRESFVDLVTPAFSSLYPTLESNSRYHELYTSSRSQLKGLRLYGRFSHSNRSGSNESLKAVLTKNFSQL